jgi:hypothetical protein
MPTLLSASARHEKQDTRVSSDSPVAEAHCRGPTNDVTHRPTLLRPGNYSFQHHVQWQHVRCTGSLLPRGSESQPYLYIRAEVEAGSSSGLPLQRTPSGLPKHLLRVRPQAKLHTHRCTLRVHGGSCHWGSPRGLPVGRNNASALRRDCRVSAQCAGDSQHFHHWQSCTAANHRPQQPHGSSCSP